MAVLDRVVMVEHQGATHRAASCASAPEDFEDKLLVANGNAGFDSKLAVARDAAGTTVHYSGCFQVPGLLQPALATGLHQSTPMGRPPISPPIVAAIAPLTEPMAGMRPLVSAALQAGLREGRPSSWPDGNHVRHPGWRPDDVPNLSDAPKLATATPAAVAGHAVPLGEVPPLRGSTAQAALMLLAPAHPRLRGSAREPRAGFRGRRLFAFPKLGLLEMGGGTRFQGVARHKESTLPPGVG
jgi:hypothetical protein